MTFSEQFFCQVAAIAQRISYAAIERLATGLAALRDRGGRLLFIGVGGSAANCSHAVNDFRKIACIEAHTPSDNVAELTARINDDGWESSYAAWLRTMRANTNDALFVLSVGGGDRTRQVSVNIVEAIDEAKRREMAIYGIVGRDGGYTKQVGDEVIVVPTVDPALITPLVESFQALVWHALVCHPVLMLRPNKWEGLAAGGQHS
jgi:D-sedoheptulose 7-phosphate isomerase